jgi:arylsulfatase A-like enzyme
MFLVASLMMLLEVTSTVDRPVPDAKTGKHSAPSLVVIVAIDQFSSDLFSQYRQHFSGGLARLSSGAVFPSAYHAHAGTETCPGHATIMTGVYPNRSGIVGNDWFEPDSREGLRLVNCARVPDSIDAGVSTHHLEAETLGDLMKKVDSRSRVAAIAGKDRVAVMLGGHQPDGRWWWSGDRFVSNPGASPPPRLFNLETTELPIYCWLPHPRSNCQSLV